MPQQTLGERIRKFRRAAGLSMGELGKHIGLSKQGVYEIEHDVVDPRVSRVVAIARVLHLEPNDLLLNVRVAPARKQDEQQTLFTAEQPVATPPPAKRQPTRKAAPVT